MNIIAKIKDFRPFKIYFCYYTSSVESRNQSNKVYTENNFMSKTFSKEILLNRFNLNILEFPELVNNECFDKAKIASLEIEKLLSTKDNLNRDTILTHLSSTGIMGLSVPGTVIGGRFTWMMMSRLIESLSLDVEYTMNKYLPQTLVCQALHLAGNDDQKNRYMNELTAGRLNGCVAITEENSDMVNYESITTNATEDKQSKCWILNGQKSQVFNYSGSDIVIVWAKTSTGEIAPFIVDSKADGLSQKMDDSGVNRLSCDLNLVNVVVPRENMLTLKLGVQFPRYVSCVNNIGVCAMSSAIIKSLLEQANDFVCSRYVFGQALSHFEVIQSHIASLTSDCYSAESVTYLTAGLLDNEDSDDVFIESLLAKSHCLEALRRSVDMCMRVIGSNCLTNIQFTKVYEDANKLLRNQSIPSLSRISLAKESMEYALEQIRVKKFSLYQKIAETIGSYKIHAMLPENIIVNSFKYNLHERLGHLADNVYGEYQELSKILKVMSKSDGFSNDDFCLHTVSGVMLDSFVMMAVLGRASRSICTGIRNHDHEVRLAERICNLVSKRIKNQVAQLKEYPRNVEEWNLVSLAVSANHSDIVLRKRLS